MNKLFQFLGSMAGRWVRILAGVILIALGIWAAQGVGRWILIIVGLVPFLAGVFDFCVFAPIFGLPFNGRSLRERLS